ncbi:hypothetical protein U1Q18_046174 [Sarracenia purpurea var. burkii]
MCFCKITVEAPNLQTISESKTISAKTSQDIRRKLGFGKSQRISVKVSSKGSPSPAQLAISGKEGGAAGCGFDRKLQRRMSGESQRDFRTVRD